MKSIIGKEITVTVDRPLGSRHPEHRDMIYKLNYGYVNGITGGDGEFQDAYIMGIDTPVESFCGVVIAVIHRLNDDEDKWVCAPRGQSFTETEIRCATEFCEKWFESVIIM